MSCKNPLLAYVRGTLPNGKKDIVILGQGKTIDVYNKDDLIQLPCGKCRSCRIDRSKAWADRMCLELETSKNAVFVTLTYRDSNLQFSELCDLVPDNEYHPASPLERYDLDGNFYLGSQPTVCVRDCQLFMKRFRKELAKDGLKCRFYLSSEYGPKTQRPHYHAILFGVGLDFFQKKDPKTFRVCGSNALKQPYYTCKWFEDIWSHGFVTVCPVTWQTCAYVARYCTKKLNGSVGDLVYGNRTPPFSLSSRRPGIGGLYLEEHSDLFDSTKVFSKYRPDGMPIPDYFLRKLELTDHELFVNIKETRKAIMEATVDFEDSLTDLNRIDRLINENRNFEVLTNSLKRDSL